mmetsp:Transcript_1037/g.3147  ORF Transcript_1037/g.3147 Transcript_1037/m.3147 type:complete len:281 (-) Transcript_1037:213-1055(-)
MVEEVGYYEMLQRFSMDSDGSASGGSDDPLVVGNRSESRVNGGSCLPETNGQLTQSDAQKEQFEGTAASAREAQERKLIKNALVWVDLEMTGLDLDKDTILEIAIIITDGDLRHELLGPELAIHHSDDVLGNMNQWSEDQHGRSGLTERCRISTISMQEAEEAAVAFVERHCDETTTHHLAGSSVHVDLTFLRRRMPALAALLPYRVVDVSTVMELCRRWYPGLHSKAPRRRGQHTALADIQDSIRALRWYRSRIFKPPQSLSSASSHGGGRVVPRVYTH